MRALRLSALAAFFLLSGCHTAQIAPSPVTSVAASPIRFRDVTAGAGITWTRSNGAFGKYWMPETMGGGGAFLDFDNDGLLDILLVNGDWWPGHALKGARPTLALYRNLGGGKFAEVTKQVGLAISIQGMGVAVGDFDNDGWDDLYITGVHDHRLLRNLGGKRFEDVTAQSGISAPGWGTSAAWVDYDCDGKLDLFVCNYVKWSPETDIYCGPQGHKSYCRPQEYPGQTCRLFHNEGNGRFRDVTKQAGIWNEGAKALGVCIVDLNDDGWPDLVVANDMEPNFVFQNNGHGAFEEIGFASGISVDESGRSRAGMGIDSADYRADGSQGLAIGNFNYEGVAFYPLSGAQPFSGRSRQTGLFAASYPYITFGLAFADFDNDGHSDLCITNGHIEDTVAQTSPGQTFEQPSVLYRNQGDGKFIDVSVGAGNAITQPIIGRGLCRGDFDNDGKVDLLLIPNSGPPHLLHNETPGPNHWLTLCLKGLKTNRDGYGAKVIVEAGGLKQSAWCRSGSSYLSASDRRLHFGLGGATKADRITVRWPGGRTETLTNQPVDRVIQLNEGMAERH